ncbi:hypothetical protein GCM10009111_28400 [Colwellia asteriadis]|uniref:Peptidoglycan-binding protein n=1 Tax=Colwellia asteriadis TaxID=517723 RepID=A0ABN1L9S1_9GAMM
MKTKLSLNSALASLALSAGLTAIGLPAYAQSEKAPRWFEVEVILFKQLGDKSLIKEQFVNTELPNYARSFDLLTPYLQPDISALKQQLPYCHSNNVPLSQSSIFNQNAALSTLKLSESINQQMPLTQAITLPELMPIKSLKDIEQQESLLQGDEALSALETDNNTFITSNDTLNKVQVNEAEINDTTNNSDDNLTVAELAKVADLVAQAEQHIDNSVFKNYTSYLGFTNKQLCQIPQSHFQTILPVEQLLAFNYNGFPVDSVPRVIDGIHPHDSDTPYLINKEALRLGDITQRLRWSKNFRPLLHLGWRQIAVTRNSSIPMTFYAGENLTQPYQKKYSEMRYQQARDELNSVNLSTAVNPQPNAEGEPSQFNEQTFAQAKVNQALNAIMAELDTVDNMAISSLITKTSHNNKQLNIEDQNNLVTPPLQPWFLDGFFKVHLDHYLYITADFNILGQSNTLSAYNKQDTSLSKAYVTNFSQDRRVITGEVHYFDHPYIGMVVQIRRFDPTKPEAEAVTQAVR